MNASRVSCGPINDMPDIEQDEQLQERGMFVTLTHPTMGDVRVIGSPLKLSEAPVIYSRPPPLAGEHTEAILKERLSMTSEAIQELRRKNTI